MLIGCFDTFIVDAGVEENLQEANVSAEEVGLGESSLGTQATAGR